MRLRALALVAAAPLALLAPGTAETAGTALGRPSPAAPAPGQTIPVDGEPATPAAGEPSRLDLVARRMRHNPRARSRAAAEAFAEGDAERAVEASRQALALDPDDPRLGYNLGTAQLAAGDLDAAGTTLAATAAVLEDAPAAPELETAVSYNLGNALLAGERLEQAIAAYETALRHDPDHAAAKHNLELALERLEEQQAEQERQDQDAEDQEQEQDGEQQQQSRPSPGDEPSEEPRQEPQQPEPDDEGGQGEEQPQPAEPEEQEGQGREADPRLPRFEDQPDMSAEEAAAILEAVEALERELRRERAEERARRKARGTKDW